MKKLCPIILVGFVCKTPRFEDEFFELLVRTSGGTVSIDCEKAIAQGLEEGLTHGAKVTIIGDLLLKTNNSDGSRFVTKIKVKATEILLIETASGERFEKNLSKKIA
jgi:hypothetical protein